MDIRAGDTVDLITADGTLHGVQVLNYVDGEYLGQVEVTDSSGARHRPTLNFTAALVAEHKKGVCHEIENR